MSEEKSIKYDKLKSLIAINTKINESYTDQNTLLISILESAMCLVECESASVLLVNKQDDNLRFVVALGPKGPEVEKLSVSKNSIAGWVAQNNKSVIIDDVRHDRRFDNVVQSTTGYVTRNMIASPMRSYSECIGVLEIINKAENKKFTQSDLDILELLANMAGITYSNAKTYSSTKDRVTILQDAVNQGKDYHTFIAKSPIIIDLMRVIQEVAKTNSSVLIIGESGVGKELFAEQLHLKSERNNKPFVRVSCAALSPTLLESELFGHVKGAYTDAKSDQKGRFELADHGTLFLDEIGELPLNLQSKLLRVIQERKFERVGSSETVSVDVRIIAATNRDLEAMVKEGTFRGDLYYRLNVLPLNIPPLRQRKEDIEPLANYYLEKYSHETKKNFKGFSSAAIKALYSYYWPGNVRELQNTVERSCILGQEPYIQVNDLRLPVNIHEDEVRSDTDIYNCAVEASNHEDRTLKTAVNTFKKEYVTKILQQTNWNQTAAAKILDVQRTYVSKLLNELDIRR